MEGWCSAQLSGHLPGVEDRETGVGVLWSETAQGKSTFHLVGYSTVDPCYDEVK